MLKLFQKQKGITKQNQFTLKLKVDFISNISYKYDKQTEFEIEWKRGNQKGTLEGVFMNMDGEIKPKKQFQIPCQFIKKTIDGESEFASKTLSINLKKIEGKKKVSSKIATLKIDISQMANKEDPTLERQYSSTMKGIEDDDFKPYIEFKASVIKGPVILDNESDLSESDLESITLTPSSTSRRGSVSSTTSSGIHQSNNNAINNPDNISPTSSINGSVSSLAIGEQQQQQQFSNSIDNPFEFNHESTPKVDLLNNQQQQQQHQQQQINNNNILSPTDSIDSQILQYETTKTSDIRTSFDTSLLPEEESLNVYSGVSFSTSPTTSSSGTITGNGGEKDKSFFNTIMKRNKKNKDQTSPPEKHVTFDKSVRKRRHSTPTLGFFGISKIKEKDREKEKEKEKEKDNNSSTSNGSKKDKISISSLKSSLKNIGSPSLTSSQSIPDVISPPPLMEREETIADNQQTLLDEMALPSVQSVLLSRSEDFKSKYLTEEIILTKKPEYVDSVPVSAIVLYKCLFEWKQFNASNAYSFSKIIETMDYLSKRETMDREKAIYWLSTCFTLKFLLERSLSNSSKKGDYSQNDNSTQSPSNNFSNNSDKENIRFLIHRLKIYERSYWKLLWQNLRMELDKLLDRLCDIVKNRYFEHNPIFLNYLLTSLDYLEKRLPFQSLYSGVFKQIFYYSASKLSNRFYSDGQLINSICAVNLKLLLSSLTQWFQENKSLNYFYYFKIEMNSILQILDVLLIDKSSLKDPRVRADICPSLNSTQLAILLSSYQPEDYREEIDPSIIKQLQDDGIRNQELQSLNINSEIIFDLQQNPDPTKNIFSIQLPNTFIQHSNQLSSSFAKNLKFLSKTTPIY
ncbi:dilute domain-containing protein [Tieghemostelium lacteum]|uniref:Dilute domain-containing protein n=1 Tax=Tieghemostelium lacteum TaxID=361077 RepID=A0A152A426_TIELA|nr:dilute domain-containing protein [Tieghemostelium lacteum]|eukprot:KYR00976.1 dilute domain-containing protein [Tieghemostelium lacteum]